MKYKLINTKTKEETLCDKVTIDGFDYYVSDELPQKNDKILCDERNHITENPKYKIRTCKSIVNDWIMTFEIDGQGENPNWTKKIIATNNPNIEIPKLVNEVESFIKKIFYADDGINFKRSTVGADDIISGFKQGYNKSQATHPFSEEDMKNFGKFCIENNVCKEENRYYQYWELLQLWKEQQPKIVYYEN